MSQRSKPIFQKVSKLLKVSILRKPIIPKLKLLMKSRKVKRLKLLRYSNYGVLHEYQFSPSNTPLIQYSSSRWRRSVKNSGFRRVCRVLFLSRCVSRLKDEEGVVDTSHGWIEALPDVIEVACPARELSESSDYDSGDESIDQRAERFIERFYQEMRKQRQESG